MAQFRTDVDVIEQITGDQQKDGDFVSEDYGFPVGQPFPDPLVKYGKEDDFGEKDPLMNTGLEDDVMADQFEQDINDQPFEEDMAGDIAEEDVFGNGVPNGQDDVVPGIPGGEESGAAPAKGFPWLLVGAGVAAVVLLTRKK